MATDVTMPRLSDSMEEGTVLKWLVEQGGEVKRGEPLVEIETDKANMTYDADTDGTLIEVVAGEGDMLPIGETIARIGDASEASQDGSGGGQSEAGGDGSGEGGSGEGESSADENGSGPREEGAEVATAEREQGGAASDGEAATDGGAPEGNGAGSRAPADGDGRIKASPVARRVAGEQGVDLSAIEGSGPGGRIVKADVLAAAEGGDGAAEGARTGEAPTEGEGEAAGEEEQEAAVPEPQRPEPRGEAGPKGQVHVQELTRIQQTVSRRMAESKATAPDYTLEAEVDMSACVELRGRLKQLTDPAPSFNDMIVKACALALREHPRVNAAYRDGQFELYEKINVGVAVAAKDALVVPTIFDAGSKSLGEISRAARELIAKVRDQTITPPELSGGTFTVSNLGMYGIDRFSAVINPPQAALLTVGALKKKPVVDDSGRIVAREAMSLSLVCDHRILYGADGAAFLARVRELLEGPLALAL
ncbi:MAG TPA: dihydrolipoamide acetyltransferase family protein [Thermoleophilaceae bacterium]|nr:dihydrolipoamide acetyltransferase family protein [Thermoleophilaceae bacterium]